MDSDLQVPGAGQDVATRLEPYKHPLTDRLNQELEARGYPTVRRERRRVLRKLKRQLEKMRKAAAQQEDAT